MSNFEPMITAHFHALPDTVDFLHRYPVYRSLTSEHQMNATEFVRTKVKQPIDFPLEFELDGWKWTANVQEAEQDREGRRSVTIELFCEPTVNYGTDLPTPSIGPVY